jgi:hypothetical protein
MPQSDTQQRWDLQIRLGSWKYLVTSCHLRGKLLEIELILVIWSKSFQDRNDQEILGPAIEKSLDLTNCYLLYSGSNYVLVLYRQMIVHGADLRAAVPTSPTFIAWNLFDWSEMWRLEWNIR